MIEVVAALIKKDNKYLIAKRSTGNPELIGKWEFPGGKVDFGESELSAIEREIKEEFEVEIKAKKFISNSICKYSNVTVDLKLYDCEYISGDFKLLSHSEYRWVTKEEFYDYDLALADIPFIKDIFNFDKDKSNFNNDLKIGNTYKNEQIREVFKCSLMRGMAKSNTTDTLVLIAKHTKNLYDDKWVDNTLYYTGEGQVGDQTLTGSNKTLSDYKKNSTRVYLFEVFEEKKYIYQGEVYLAEKPFKEKQIDKNNNEREVWVFPLKKRYNEGLLPLEIIEENQLYKHNEISKKSDVEISELIDKLDGIPSKREIITTYIERNAAVSEKTKRRANGICDLCEKEAPFKNKEGKPYLETHHVIVLADGGPDQIYNTVALCPNCHRKVHILESPADIKKLSSVIYNYLLSENDIKNIEMFESYFD